MQRFHILNVGMCFLLIVGCSTTTPSVTDGTKATSSTSITLGYGAPGLDAGQVAIMNGLKKHAATKDWDILTVNANRNARVQSDQIAYLISQHVDALVVVPEDSEGICHAVRQAQQAGIPFYTIDRAPIGCAVNMTILANNYMAGTQSAEALLALLSERYGVPRGTVLELQGNLRQNVAQLRAQGFHAIVDQYPDIDVIAKPTNWQAHQFAVAAQEAVSQGHIDAIYLHSDCVGVPAVLPILAQLERKLPRESAEHIFIVGVDGCAETLQAIREGFVDQASSQPFPDFGIIIDWVEKERRGEPIVAGTVREAGAPWSPATLESGEAGWQLLLATTSVTMNNVDTPTLWGNQ